MPRKLRDSMRAGLLSENESIKRRFAAAENFVVLAEAKRTMAVEPESSSEETAPTSRKGSTRVKTHRRTFSITDNEIELFASLKRKCNLRGFETSQSELIRAGLIQLDRLDQDEFVALLESLPKLPKGRPAI